MMETSDYKLNSHPLWNLSVQTLGNTNATHSPSTSTTGADDWNTLTYMGTFGAILTFGFVLVAVVAVTAVKFCETYKNASGFGDACKVFAKCGWLRDVCRCEGGDDEDGESETVGDASEREASDHWDPPRYRDALRMQRLDSTTILGIPPPLYDSVESKEQTEFEGYTNLGFEYAGDFARHVSWDLDSMSISRAVFQSDDTISRVDVSNYDQTNDLAPVHASSQAREDAPHITLSVCDEIGHSGNVNSGCVNNCSACSSNRMSRSFGLELPVITIGAGSQQYSNSPIEDHTDALGIRTISEHVDKNIMPGAKSSFWDRLPSYEDVLSWIQGTDL